MKKSLTGLAILGISLISSQVSADATMYEDKYPDEVPYIDISSLVIGNTIFIVIVGDGTSTRTVTRSYVFCYPYYVGVGVPGLIGAQIVMLTKFI